ncbi:MAG: DUF72 domain-containing protein [Dehalococcoidia bacterium]|nr:DUF72 domain-containing protein [Dehalococcoidia bacterium]
MKRSLFERLCSLEPDMRDVISEFRAREPRLAAPSSVKWREDVRVGCCGFAGGRGAYFSRFKLVEIQQTFYQPPSVETARRWRREAPPDFEFTVKAWQLITHPAQSPSYARTRVDISPQEAEQYGFFRPTPQVKEAWQRTREIAKALRARVVVFQSPAQFGEAQANIDNLRGFFKGLEREFIMVWEPRGGWQQATVRRLCRELDLVHCADPFSGEQLWGKPAYFRLHGHPHYRRHYSDEELRWLKDLIGERRAYVLFNNITMYEDALKFGQLLAAQA